MNQFESGKQFDEAAAVVPEPQFGLVDLIEAFTALRHEYRGQTRESREVAVAIREAVTRIESIGSTPNSVSSDTVRRLVDAIVEIDLITTRAVEAAERSRRQAASPGGESSDADNGGLPELHTVVVEEYERLGIWKRWLCSAFFQNVLAEIDLRTPPKPPPDMTIEGLRMVVARIRGMMQEHDIERTEAEGTAFDGDTMHAIDAVDSASHRSGTIVQQLCPIYRWKGKLIRYAEVIVAK